MKEKYGKPNISLLPTKSHMSTMTTEEPEDFSRSRRDLLIKGGLIATAGHISLYGGTDIGPASAQSTPAPQQSDSTNKDLDSGL